MYENYFNLTERPFASVPRADHYYPAGVIDAARNTLARCIDRGEGVAMIVGPSGTGKSLLCQVLAEHFRDRVQVAVLACTHLDTRRSLLQAMLYELNRPYRGMDEGELRLSLIDYLTLNDDCAAGMLLLVDEAQHLPMRLLDEVRALTNLTREMQPAVRLVLAGNHVLEERFASPKLESFSQRISARCYLEAFQGEETQAYIWARIMVCGGRGSEIFPVETCRMVHKATGGVPRLINQVCDHVLLLAYAAGVRRIEPAHVEEAWADLQQLPTPWNAPATPASDSVIEFGGLDDAPSESSAIAGKISAANDDDGLLDADASFEPLADSPAGGDGEHTGCVEFSTHVDNCRSNTATLSAAGTGDSRSDEGARQLRHIRTLLADVRAEFQPRSAERPEVELIFDAPHPFAEPFEEEELVADRYAYAAPQPHSTVQPAAAAAKAAAAASAFSAVPIPTAPRDPVPTVTLNRADPPPETIPRPHDRRCDPSDTPAAPTAEDRPARQVPPPRRKEFGRLFAGLRRGL